MISCFTIELYMDFSRGAAKYDENFGRKSLLGEVGLNVGLR